jgi:glutamate-ammonia-ligase adenylyltransferase
MNTDNAASTAFDHYVQHMLQGSRYAARTLATDNDLLNWLQQHHATPCTREEIETALQPLAVNLHDETVLGAALRHLRKQILLKLILRDLNGLADLNEVMQAMTALAEICVQHALNYAMQAAQAQFGEPLGTSTVQPLLVIGMGKLGGGELNVSSDIDLIFVYPEDGETNGDRKISNHDFFTRVGRRLISLLNELTADGYVFRVDMRLRPYGDSGPLAMSFAALEEYLISQGRAWERYAWIKARVINTIQAPYVAELSQLVQPFIYRKYLDFGAIDAMRQLHAQIRAEVMRRERHHNIKLGPGGIREIEFIAQVFQIIRGGRDTRLRGRATQEILRQLASCGYMPQAVTEELDVAYRFLRNLEHRLQYLNDQQTQELPAQPEDQAIIAQTMGYAGYTQFLNALDLHRATVSAQFDKIFGTQKDATADESVWNPGSTTEDLSTHLATLGYRVAHDTAQRLLQLRDSSRYSQLPEASRSRLDKLIPHFIQLCAQQNEPDTALLRLLELLESISRRAAYLAFLAEHPQALALLTRLVAASSWAAHYLTQHPALLDELLDTHEIYLPPQWQQIDQELQTHLADSVDDIERQLDVLRHTQQAQTFHLLAMDLQGLLPLETLSDHLSDLADLILRHVLALCWANTRNRHREDVQFAIVAYGKLGGKELGYASDLDIIFLYEDDHPDAPQVYARLGQRINTMLGSYTASGRLYETDLRLRPNGESGLLVSPLAAFAEYQRHQAWLWEHQALTRARFSAGNARIGAAFEQLRQEVLCQPRDLANLRKEILGMRQKMRDGHRNDSDLFDIKHDMGGMVDIEFIVQYLVLAYAHLYPQLADNIGNLALLRLASKLGLISNDLAERTCTLYRQLRQIQHRMRLNSQSLCRIEPGVIDTAASQQLWNSLLADS